MLRERKTFINTIQNSYNSIKCKVSVQPKLLNQKTNDNVGEIFATNRLKKKKTIFINYKIHFTNHFQKISVVNKIDLAF